MGSVLNESLHKEMLEYTLFSGKVRLQDIAFPLNSLSSASDAGGKACWNMFQTQHDRFKGKFASGPMWGSCVGLACRGLRTLQEADDVESFFKINDPGSAKRRLVQGLEAIRTHAMRLTRDVDQVATYLSSLQD
jgi:ERAP1-like C-terminal domain